MDKRLYTAADVRALLQRGATRLDLGADDLVTAEAEDTAASGGLALIRAGGQSTPAARAGPVGSGRPTIRVIRGGATVLEPFAFDVKRPEMNIRTTDVITDRDGSPIGAGYMSFEQGAFPWTLNYDEIDIVLEGELVIRVGDCDYSGHEGDIIYIPKGTSIQFSTPTRCRFAYVTFPANWNAQ